ncbi:hypothetical protein L6164_023409 [Bauhinia variegata]|uniref:Uncharacterized protein n=1 Tax=Bauhinia variegata TaxID=167791 RepID=A0ACB9MI40_BAUVA|nr:hypothetical protein L6164_023409 [Bauhinia variegata]
MRAEGRRCSDHIPSDLHTEILIWLPVKSLMRFTSVSKSWQSLIKDSTFIASHRRTAPSSRKQSLLVRKRESRWDVFNICISIHYDSNDFNYENLEDMDLEIPGEILGPVYSLYTCYELVCLVYYDFNIIIWNPSINKFITLPKPDHGGCSCHFSTHFGFGFDPKTNDYKVVRTHLGSYSVEIFSLNTGSWRQVDYEILCFSVADQHICVNGVIYWIDGFVRNIMGFDLGDDEFLQISLCTELGSALNTLELAELRESICIIQYRNRIGFTDKQLCSIWVMEEPGVFLKLMTISSAECLGRALCFKANGEILTACLDKRLVYSYDPSNSQLSYCGSISIDDYYLELNTYVESLVLL